jgi:hypothetical protein
MSATKGPAFTPPVQKPGETAEQREAKNIRNRIRRGKLPRFTGGWTSRYRKSGGRAGRVRRVEFVA